MKIKETKNCGELQKISCSMKFLEVFIFSDIRFVQYAYRTYEKFRGQVCSWPTKLFFLRIGSSVTKEVVHAHTIEEITIAT